ncbi:MAG: hypothetical protein Q9168_003178 [Polycauliona sp. 1 TL-2023]
MPSSDPCKFLLQERHILTEQLFENPYSCITYIFRAQCHGKLGYPDLAAADAYRALLLADEISDDSFEYHEETLETYNQDVVNKEPSDGFWLKTSRDTDGNPGTSNKSNVSEAETSSSDENDPIIDEIVQKLQLKCFASLSDYLCQCGCLRDAYDFAQKGLLLDPGNSVFLNLRRKAIQTHNQALPVKDPDRTKWNYDPREELPIQGHARRELYPWNRHEPDRFSEESLDFLNREIKKVAPKCEVRAVSLPVLETSDTRPNSPPATIKQLGVFAKEDIAPHETILQERSLLTANNRLHDPLCDACSAPLPPISDLESSSPLPACPDCDDIIFCSSTCYDLATSLYHPAVCGKPDLEAIAKDPSPLAATNALYLLLLGRTFALAETQCIHPLDLTETKYLWGDYTPPPPPPHPSSIDKKQEYARHLPFTFSANILAPLHLLLKMDIDIFASLSTTDPWIISTLLAKFRGVASARMNPRTGIPEVCAVHPMWCLANHSCAPNVKWEWSGDIKFEARGGEDVVQWGDVTKKEGGIKKGEEVLNHYCDVGLGVEERREWAAGALGGMCICERCVWEDSEERGDKGIEAR